MWDLPGLGIEPMCPQLAGRLYTTGSPGSHWKPKRGRLYSIRVVVKSIWTFDWHFLLHFKMHISFDPLLLMYHRKILVYMSKAKSTTVLFNALFGHCEKLVECKYRGKCWVKSMVSSSCWNNIWQSESKPDSWELILKEMKANCRILGLAYSCLSVHSNHMNMLGSAEYNLPEWAPLNCQSHHWTLGENINI